MAALRTPKGLGSPLPPCDFHEVGSRPEALASHDPLGVFSRGRCPKAALVADLGGVRSISGRISERNASKRVVCGVSEASKIAEGIIPGTLVSEEVQEELVERIWSATRESPGENRP